MSDSIILALIVFLILCLIVTVVAAVVYSGLFTEVNIKTGSPYIKNVTIAYKFHKGPYKDCGAAFTETVSIGPKLNTIRVSYDDSTEVRHLMNGMLTCERIIKLSSLPDVFLSSFQRNKAWLKRAEWNSDLGAWIKSAVQCHVAQLMISPPSVVPVCFGISMQLTKTWQPWANPPRSQMKTQNLCHYAKYSLVLNLAAVWMQYCSLL